MTILVLSLCIIDVFFVLSRVGKNLVDLLLIFFGEK